MARKPLWQEIEEMSPRERINSVKQHNQNLNRFMTATSESVDKLSIIRKAIKKSEKKIIQALERDKQAEAISEILRLRVLRVDEMVELSALSLIRSNRFTTSWCLMSREELRRTSSTMQRAFKPWY